jgi:radical SAM protein (TIGR01212 family)
VFCDNQSFSPSRRRPGLSIREQIDEGIRRCSRRHACQHFLAYFQPATNTYAPLPRLRSVYQEALTHAQVVGLAIGTRSDCAPDEVLELLDELSHRSFLSVEYGLQTMHDRSLDWMNRGHHHDAFLDVIARSRGRGFSVGAHAILGLPGESHDDMLATARELARLNLDSVKIHNLYAVRNTPLADQVGRGEVKLLTRDDYVRLLVDFLELLPPAMVIERVAGDAPPEFLVAPAWCLDKPSLRRALQEEFARRDTWQGKRWIQS